MNSAYNRTALILGLIILAGWLAWLKVTDIGAIIQAVAAPLAIYVAVKGPGKEGRSS